MKTIDLFEQLGAIGLSELEARTYVALLKNGPSTAYAVGRLIAKPTANVYKAADGLESKGAIVSSKGARKLLQALPPEEFLSHVRRSQGDRLDRVGAALRALRSAPVGVGLFQLENVDAVFERARRMLGSATAIAVIDAFPAALKLVSEDIRAAVQRGVAVYVQSYGASDVECTSLSEVTGGESILSRWRSVQLNVVVDAQEAMLALCTDDLSRVVEAYWTNSLYVACMLQAGFLREHAFHQIRRLAMGGAVTPGSIIEVLEANPNFGSVSMPGQRLLMDRIEHMETKA